MPLAAMPMVLLHLNCMCCAPQMLLQSVLRPGAGVATGSLAVGVPALLAAFGSAVEGAAAANPGQAQARSDSWVVQTRGSLALKYVA